MIEEVFSVIWINSVAITAFNQIKSASISFASGSMYDGMCGRGIMMAG